METGSGGDSPPPGIDLSRPHTARMYDYLLGGKDHFAIDRETMEVGLRSWPAVRVYARENRNFLARAVEYLTREAGVRQFLDIGTGLPSANNVHEVAQRITPEARVVYVDNDPLVLSHAKALLTSHPAGRTAYIHADLREPQAILRHPVVRDTLDFSQPIALMLVAILHFIPDSDDPAGIVAALMSALPPGSYLVSSHVTAELDRTASAAWSALTGRPGCGRGRATRRTSAGCSSPAWNWCRRAWCSSPSGGQPATMPRSR